MKPDPLLGAVIDHRYAISARIARGGMATVYHATDRRLERKVAIKVIHDHLAEQPDFVRRFISEARAAASLSSPHIVAVHDQGVASLPSGERPYLVMELMSGPDLRSELAAYGSFSLGVSLEIVRQVLSGLAVAHEADIIHRDIKPENVLLTAALEPTSIDPKFQAKLTDFGLARAASDATSTHTNSMLGTVGYVAPEFITDGATSKASDIYSIGIMLYELIAGQLPFQGESGMNVAFKHVNDTMPRLADQADWMPPAVDALISLFTAKSPAKRPVNAQAALDALTDVVASLPEETLIRRIPVFPTEQAPTQAIAAGTSVLPISPTQIIGDGSNFSDLIQPALAGRQDTQVSRHNTQVEDLRRRRRRWPILLVLLLALLGGGSYGTWWYFTQGPGLRINVPNVINLPQADAESALTNAGLVFDVVKDYSDDIVAGHVLAIDPAVGVPIHPSTPVKLVVSEGVEHVNVPDVIGKPQDEASSILQSGRLGVGVTQAYSEDIAEGAVISQTPASGSFVPHSTSVKLIISLGKEPLPVPDLTKDTLESANRRLDEIGMKGAVTEEFSDTVPAGVVIRQDPVPGEHRHRGDTINMVVSKGPELVKVPNVFGLQEAQATKILKEAGFGVTYNRFLGGYFGTVRAQSPGAGEMVKPGTLITITVV